MKRFAGAHVSRSRVSTESGSDRIMSFNLVEAFPLEIMS